MSFLDNFSFLDEIRRMNKRQVNLKKLTLQCSDFKVLSSDDANLCEYKPYGKPAVI